MRPLESCQSDVARVVGASVLIVSVTGTGADELSATELGAKLQLASGGRLEHMDGDKALDPMNPVCPVRVSIVVPDCPAWCPFHARLKFH